MMKLFILMLVLMTSSAHAQTTPTANETRIGTTCTKSTHSTDFDTLAQCTSIDGSAGTMQKAPLFIGAVTAPPYAAVTCDADKKGMIQHTGTELQYCDGTTWQIVPTKEYVDAAGGGATTRRSQVFTTSGTWTKPVGVTSIDVVAVGGGAGADGCQASYSQVSNGGGGGGIVWSPGLVISGDLAITVGSAGIGGVGSGNGTNGGDSIVGSIVTASGGGRDGYGDGGRCPKGEDGTSDTLRAPIVAPCPTGGGGGGGTSSSKGNYGNNPVTYITSKGADGGHSIFPIFSRGLPGLGTSGSNGINGVMYRGAGGGGASFSGKGGDGGKVQNGGNATGYGGGGGGCTHPSSELTDKTGGSGAPGVVIIYWDE